MIDEEVIDKIEFMSNAMYICIGSKDMSNLFVGRGTLFSDPDTRLRVCLFNAGFIVASIWCLKR